VPRRTPASRVFLFLGTEPSGLGPREQDAKSSGAFISERRRMSFCEGDRNVDRVPMTMQGHEALKNELRRLKSEDRPEVVRAIEEARAHGDLSENAEYAAAKEKQSFIETRIGEIEGKLARADVIDTAKLSGSRVVFGATVTLLDYASDQEQIWTIVGDDESSIESRKVGISSPIARALIGKEEGDEVQIRTPGGVKEAEILNVQFS
jgi:transcription elongation factor GreA